MTLQRSVTEMTLIVGKNISDTNRQKKKTKNKNKNKKNSKFCALSQNDQHFFNIHIYASYSKLSKELKKSINI